MTITFVALQALAAGYLQDASDALTAAKTAVDAAVIADDGATLESLLASEQLNAGVVQLVNDALVDFDPSVLGDASDALGLAITAADDAVIDVNAQVETP